MRVLRSRAMLLTSLEYSFLMLTLLILERDARLSFPWSRPVLWLAMFVLPVATIHCASSLWRGHTAADGSVHLYFAGASAFALIWPIITSVFLFRAALDDRYDLWIGIALVMLLVVGIVLINVAYQGRRAFSVQPHQRQEIVLTAFVGIITLMLLFYFLR
jgi:hypothetical protein